VTQARFMVTNGGTHPPEKWALETAEHLVSIGPDVDGPTLMAATRVKMNIANALVESYADIQTTEKSKLASDPDATHASPLGVPDDHLNVIVGKIKEQLANSPWSDMAQDEDAHTLIANHVHGHLMEQQAIERSWHLDGVK
jgi:hypothetical protein